MNKPLVHDSRKVFTFCHRTHEHTEYPYTWSIGFTGVSMMITKWCEENCRHDWGWWFDENRKAVIGFFDKSEMMQARLINSDLVD